MTGDSKFFEAAQALGQSLSQWDLLILGGSLLLIVSTSYYRPPSRKVRASYFLFLPAWALLAFSVYEGIQIQGSYVAYLIAVQGSRPKPATTINEIAAHMEQDTRLQIQGLEFALLCLAVWLVIYIVWWVVSEESAGDRR